MSGTDPMKTTTAARTLVAEESSTELRKHMEDGSALWDRMHDVFR